MTELQYIEGSGDTIPTVVKNNGETVTTGHQVQLVPFETGQEIADLTETGDWRTAPPVVSGYTAGYYCVFTRLTTADGDPIVDHAGHVRIVKR